MLAALQSSCTFYTACPSGNSTGAPGGQGGTGNAPNGPLTTGAWVDVTSNLTGMASECGNLSKLSAKPDENLLIVGIAQAGLWSSSDNGATWQAMGTASGSVPITNRTSSILYDPQDTQSFWESGLYNSFAVYQTSDDGSSFANTGTITHSDFVTVDFADPDRKTLLASGHEQAHKLYMTSDAGANWHEIGDKIPAEAQTCPFPYVIDAQTFLLGCGSYGGGKTGIYRSTDAGQTWTKVSSFGGGAAPLIASDGSIYWASEGTGGIVKSTDQGLTWADPIGVGVVGSVTPMELPDGKLATLGSMAVLESSDDGMTWKSASSALPYVPTGVVYSVQGGAFYVWHWTCGVGTDRVPAGGIMRYDPDAPAM